MSYAPFHENNNRAILNLFNITDLVSISTNDITGENEPFERTYEQLITERGEFTIRKVNENYEDIFNQIKCKLFLLNPIERYKEKPEYNEKYQTNNFINSLKHVKKQIVLLYNKKVEQEILISEKTRLYTDFCSHITESLKIINKNFKETDETFKNMLSNKIDEYYNSLNLDELTDSLSELNNEFEYTKSLIYLISEINPQLCMLCMENQINYFNDPCGHTICGECKDKYESQNCHYCRASITKRCKLFY